MASQTLAPTVTAMIQAVNRVDLLLQIMGEMEIATAVLTLAVQDQKCSMPIPRFLMMKSAEKPNLAIAAIKRFPFRTPVLGQARKSAWLSNTLVKRLGVTFDFRL